MAAIVGFVFSLAGLLSAIAVAALWLGVRPSSRAGRRFLVVVLTLYILASIYALPYGLGRLLVMGYHQVSPGDIPAGRTAIVVLSAGNAFAENWSHERFFYLNEVGAARMWEAYRIYRLTPDAWVISSEASARLGLASEPRYPAQHDALVHLGVPASRVMVLRDVRDTHDEAVRMAPIIKSLNVNRVVLVTSDIHMRRSVGTFHAQSLDVIPAIVRDPELVRPWRDWIVPTRQGLELSSRLVHEVLGIPFYAVRGWLRL